MVGGDYYDYFILPDNRVGVAIGDVVGHEFYSGLLVAIVSTGLTFQLELNSNPSAVIESLNKVVRNYRHARMLMSFSYILLDPFSFTLTLTSAGGYPSPYIYHHSVGEWNILETKSPPLGAFPQIVTKSLNVQWEPGDRLFLYTDGVIETQNEDGQEYRASLLEEALNRNVSLPPADMISAMYEELDDYRGNRPFDDDITMVVVEFI